MSENPLGTPMAPYTPAPMPVAHDSAPRRSSAVVILGVVVVVQMLVIIGLALMLGSLVFLGPLGMMDMSFDDDVYLLADEVGYEVRTLAERGDVAGYMALYDAGDAHVDTRKVREEFEALIERVTVRDASIDVYPGMWQEYVDTESGERLVRLDLELSDWDSGRSVSRLRVWVVLDGPTGEIALTGNVRRELESVGAPW